MSTLVITSAKKRIEARNERIKSLAAAHASRFGTKLELYLFIGEKVGCSHITVYKVLRRG